MRFQRKVSLTWCRGSSGDDRDTTDRTDSNHRAGCRLRRGERAGGVPAAGAGRRLRVRGADADAARLPRAGQAVEGTGEALPGEDHQLFPRPAHAAHPPAPRDGAGGRPSGRQPGATLRAPADIRLLARVDADLGQMSGLATRVVPHREHHVFGDARFERLAGISASHIYNLRGSRTYRTQRTVVQRTKATAVTVGERRAPQPDGWPGFLRVDTVHAWTASTLATATAPRACT